MQEILQNAEILWGRTYVSLWRPLHTENIRQMMRLAEDRKSSATTLCVLSYHDDERIRSLVADNPSTPDLTLLRLARDESDNIRYQMAGNHGLPTQVLAILSADDNPYVRARAELTLERLRDH
jgi:hypothetical protein